MNNNPNYFTADGTSGDFNWVVKEIQAMMYGFGDSSSPSLASALLIEEVMVQQLRSAVAQAAQVAARRGSSAILPEDFIFLMRKNKVKTQRLLKYLDVKDKNKLSSATNLDESNFLTDITEIVMPVKKRSQNCMDFLHSINSTLRIENDMVDVVKRERLLRADKVSRLLKPAKYLEYSNARRASFSNTPAKASLFYARLFGNKKETSDEPILSRSAYDVLGYFAHETVAQIVDLALLVRRDSYTQVGDPVSRFIPSTHTFPYTVPTNTQVEGAPPLSPSEIREALRRYWSPRISRFNSSSNIHTRLLAI